jgi:cytochrome c
MEYPCTGLRQRSAYVCPDEASAAIVFVLKEIIMNALSRRIFAFAFCSVALLPIANAQERGTREEAKAMAEAAAAHITKVGAERAFQDFADPANKDWHRKDLYTFVFTMAGVQSAHGVNPKMVSKDLSQMRDANGKAWVQDMVAVARKGSGWVDYDWAHPQTKKVEAKSAYIVKPSGYDGFVGVGYYK